MAEFDYKGHRISYDEHVPADGSRDRPIVLVHGLLMNRRMFDRLAPALAERGNYVITVDLLGHGRSDRPPEMVNYSMTLFAEQVVALLDHLELKQAIVGGTSLGANVSLETAHQHPDRVKAILCEMPVLDNALAACGVIFTPALLALRFGEPLFKLVANVTSRIPRTNPLLDLGLDWIRQDPEPSAAVLEGLFLGRIAPHHDERVRLEHPALIVGHQGDPLHPFSDSGMLAEEMPNSRKITARTIMEWRLFPDRLDDELNAWLESVWDEGSRGGAFARLRRNGHTETDESLVSRSSE
jgi:pimeloyl-ACP methyl ester carboxylesterase